MGGLGPVFVPLWAVLAALGVYVGGLGPLSGPVCAVLGCSWGLCGRSWAALGIFVGGVGPLLGLLFAVLGRLGPKSGPAPSGKTILGRKVALP